VVLSPIVTGSGDQFTLKLKDGFNEYLNFIDDGNTDG
jgi:hypothetical protein